MKDDACIKTPQKMCPHSSSCGEGNTADTQQFPKNRPFNKS